jgi:hypothetical protein
MKIKISKLFFVNNNIYKYIRMKSQDEHIGKRIGPYSFLKRLGDGNNGKVYEVIDSKTHKTVACKYLCKNR